MRNQFLKVYTALGFKYSSNHQNIDFSSNVRNEKISVVIPEPCELNITESNLEDAKYEAWLADHPSALMSFEGMMSIAKRKKIVVFLDYDGTLSPIVEDPDVAFMSDTMRSAVRQVASLFPTAIISGRSRNKVLEIRPSINWNKGNALVNLLETLGFAESSDVLPIYIGDDTTDEDAFKVIHKRGQGFPILVSKKAKETRASYSLRDPSEVLSFLLRLARWQRNSSTSIYSSM